MNWAAEILRTTGLTASERLALLCLAHAHHAGTGACFPSVETVAAFSGLSERRAKTALHSLADRGLVHINKRTVRGRQRSNQYDLNFQWRGDAGVTPKRQLRGDKKSTPQISSRKPRGVTPASPDKEERKIKGTEGISEAEIVRFPAGKNFAAEDGRLPPGESPCQRVSRAGGGDA